MDVKGGVSHGAIHHLGCAEFVDPQARNESVSEPMTKGRIGLQSVYLRRHCCFINEDQPVRLKTHTHHPVMPPILPRGADVFAQSFRRDQRLFANESKAKDQVARKHARRRVKILISNGCKTQKMALNLTLEVASYKASGDQTPTIGDYEEGQFEWQRNNGRRHHHHPHAHQYCRGDQVDDQKRKENQKADLKRARNLRQQETGDQERQGRVFAQRHTLCIGSQVCHRSERIHIQPRGHERAKRLQGADECRLRIDQIIGEGLQAARPCLGKHRLHDKVGQEERKTDNEHVRRRLLQTDRLAQDGEYGHKERKAGDHDGKTRRQTQDGDQGDQLKRARTQRTFVAK